MIKRKNETSSLTDIICKDLGVDLARLTAELDGAAQLRKFAPTFRFNFKPNDVFIMLASRYQKMVQSRNREFILDESVTKAIWAVSKNMTAVTPKPGMIFSGLQGNGKTTLAKALLELIRDLNRVGHFKYLGESFYLDSRIIKATDICVLYRTEDFNAIRTLKDVAVLIIDDVGEEPKEILVYGSPVFPIREIIESRYDSLKFTVLTTNLTNKDLPDHYGWRVVDRLRETYLPIPFKGSSYR